MKTLRPISPKEKHHFFGYYNISPWNHDGQYALGLNTDFIDHNPKKTEPAKIILFDLFNKTQKTLGETRAWCWQQGCMLQWMPNKENQIIYNDLRRGKFVSVIYDIKKGKEIKIINSPIYTIHPSGEWALSLNFSRLHDTRISYGYHGVKDPLSKDKYPEKGGINLINLKTGKSKLLISFKDLRKFNYLNSMEKGKHWIDHISFSPDGKRFCFFHRWYLNKEIFHTRLFTAGLDGKDLFLFPDSGFYSHIDWKDNKTLFGYGSISTSLGALRKGDKKSNFILEKILPIYRILVPKFIRKRVLPVSYLVIKDKTHSIKKFKLNSEDGHSSFSPDKKYIITDTYPDKKNYRKLILFDCTKKGKKIIGKFYSIPNKRYLGKKISDFGNSAFRCDLHPRWNHKGDKICIDSVHEGYRGIYQLDL